MAKAPKMTPDRAARARQIVRGLLEYQTELFAMGLRKTSADLGKACDTIGWEIGERMEAAGLVGEEEAERRKRFGAFEKKNRAA